MASANSLRAQYNLVVFAGKYVDEVLETLDLFSHVHRRHYTELLVKLIIFFPSFFFSYYQAHLL